MSSHPLVPPFRRLGLVLACAISASAGAVPFVIVDGTTLTGRQTITGAETGMIGSGATLTQSGNEAVRWSDATPGTVVIDNRGTVSGTAGARGIDTQGAGGTDRAIVLDNHAGALLAADADAFRINFDLVGSATVNNAGTIRSASGQALDFDAITDAGGSALIVNAATGVIESLDADAVRPGANGTVVNSGRISAGGAGFGGSNDSSDAVDFQDWNGTVQNLAGGLIEGARHGITGDGSVDVTNAVGGEIVGRNGAGVNLDGDGTVVNHGLIRGSHNPILAAGDGDGVDIDGVGDIDNSGRIEALGAAGIKDGDLNRADGIAFGGGRIHNQATGVIYSSDRGVLVDDSNGGAAFAATEFVNAGLVDAANEAIQFRGERDDTLINRGRIVSRNGGVAVDMGAGNDQLALGTGGEVAGSLAGGAGEDRLLLTGAGSGTFGAIEQFETVEVESGSWTLNGDLALASNEILLIDSAGQLTVTGDAMVGGTLALDYGALDSSVLTGASLLRVDGTLQLGPLSQLKIDFAGWQPALDAVLDLVSASSIAGVDLNSVLFAGLATNYEVLIESVLRDDRTVLSLRFAQAAEVPEPKTLVLLALGLAAIPLARRQAKRSA